MLINFRYSHGERKKNTFAVGHFSLGYLFAKSASRKVRTYVNLPLIFTLSVLPDIDFIIPFVDHRGPLHSVVLLTTTFIPIFIKYKMTSLPYYFAMLQHELIGDIIGGKEQLLWPITTQYYGFDTRMIRTLNVALELMLFLLAFIVLLKTRDINRLIRPKNSSLILLIPLSTVLLPSFLAYPLRVPNILLTPHLAYTILFAVTIATYIFTIRKGTKKQHWLKHLYGDLAFIGSKTAGARVKSLMQTNQ